MKILLLALLALSSTAYAAEPNTVVIQGKVEKVNTMVMGRSGIIKTGAWVSGGILSVGAGVDRKYAEKYLAQRALLGAKGIETGNLSNNPAHNKVEIRNCDGPNDTAIVVLSADEGNFRPGNDPDEVMISPAILHFQCDTLSTGDMDYPTAEELASSKSAE